MPLFLKLEHDYNSHFFPQTWLHLDSLFLTNMITISNFSIVTLPTIFTMPSPPAPRSLLLGFSLSSWQLSSGIIPWRMQQANRGRRPLTFLDTVARDAGLDVGDVRTV